MDKLFAAEAENFSCLSGKKYLLKNLSFTLSKGSFTVIVGPNGSGKTTLLKCLLNINNKVEGLLKAGGKSISEISALELSREFAYVPQFASRLFPFTVYDFILSARYAENRSIFGYSNLEKNKITEIIEETGITTLVNRDINTLSSGEFQKILVVSALAQNSRTILLDEPTSNLDPLHSEEILKLLHKTNREKGTTIIMVTHDLNLALLNSEHILGFKEGALLFDGKAEELAESSLLENLFEKKFSFLEFPSTKKKFLLPDLITFNHTGEK